MRQSPALMSGIEPRLTPKSLGLVGIAGLVAVAILTAPPVPAAAALLVGSALVLFLVRPLTGAFLATLVHPVGSIKAMIRVGFSRPMDVYLFEALDLLLLLVLIVRAVANRDRTGGAGWKLSAEERWIWFFFAAFVAWTGFGLVRSGNLTRDLFGMVRLDCNFVLMLFVARYLNDYRTCIRLLTWYCGVAFVFCSAALYASYYAAYSRDYLHVAPDWSIATEASLFNTSAGFNAAIVGLVPGFGLCGKHELGMLLSAAVVFSLLLLRHYRDRRVRFLLVLCILLFETIIYQAFIKLSIVGTFLILGTLCVAIAPWRRWVVPIMVGLIALNLTGFFAARAVEPSHTQKVESTAGVLRKTASRSRFQFGSIAQRADLWSRSFGRIVSSRGLGNGPDSLSYDLPFNSPIAHNWVLNFMADYGVVPALFVVAALLGVLVRAYRRLSGQVRVRDSVWLLQLGCSLTVISALFEYSLDCFLWWPHLWFMIGLLLAVLRLPAAEDGVPRTGAAVAAV